MIDFIKSLLLKIEFNMQHIFKHWKTSVGGLFVIVFTAMLWFGKITASDWQMLIGALVGMGLIIAKDFDKVKDAD